MSNSKAIILRCDTPNCFEIIDAQTHSLKIANAKAQIYHWAHRKGTHLCPQCAMEHDINVLGAIVPKEQAA